MSGHACMKLQESRRLTATTTGISVQYVFHAAAYIIFLPHQENRFCHLPRALRAGIQSRCKGVIQVVTSNGAD